jgi:branched-subunit amino acid transport protein
LKGYLPVIIGMALVTYLPRVIPLMALKDRKIEGKMKRFLQYIPYTSLSVLIIRGILTSSQEMIIPTILGISSAALAAYLKENLLLSVFAGILVSYLLLQ